MTATAELITIFALSFLAPVTLLVGIRVAGSVRLRYVRPRNTQQAPTEPAHRPGDTTWTMRLPLVRHLVQRLRPTPPIHLGATATWSPAADIASVGTAPELVTAPQQMEADHHTLDTIAAAQLAFGQALEAALDRFLRDDPLTRMRLASAVEATDTWDATELRALLDAEDAALVGAR